MRRESLKGLEFRNFAEIPEFDEKLTEFLNGLDEELKTWRDYVEKNGKRGIPHGITGYACLDCEKIVGISYFHVPKKLRIRYFINLLLARASPKEAAIGSVVKTEYQRRGIFGHLFDLRNELMRETGYGRVRYVTDFNNIAMLKWGEKKKHRIVKKTDKEIYFVYNLADDERARG